MRWGARGFQARGERYQPFRRMRRDHPSWLQHLALPGRFVEALL
jgi:hypothetical protein